MAARKAGGAPTGPLHVQRGPVENPLFQAFVEAGRQAGFELTEDYNGSKQEGFGLMEQTIHNGQRWSAADAYLRPALKRKNVSLVNAPGAPRCHRESPRAGCRGRPSGEGSRSSAHGGKWSSRPRPSIRRSC